MYRLLIVDDERATLNGLCNYIPWDQMGFIVEGSAANGKAALAYLENHTVDVLLSDIRMPVMDGIELVARVRELGYDMECVFLSAHRDFEYAKKGLQYGVLDYILKPWDEKELMLVLEEAMRLAGEKEEQTRIGKVAEQPEAGQQIMEEEPDYANENLRISKVTEMLKDYICENYMKDLSVQQMAEKTNYSEPHFCRLFKQSFGQNFTSYLTEYRINMAKKMLEQPTVNVKDVGKNVGYEDSNYFTKVFRRITGQSPTEYRNTVFREKG